MGSGKELLSTGLQGPDSGGKGPLPRSTSGSEKAKGASVPSPEEFGSHGD